MTPSWRRPDVPVSIEDSRHSRLSLKYLSSIGHHVASLDKSVANDVDPDVATCNDARCSRSGRADHTEEETRRLRGEMKRDGTRGARRSEME